MTFYGQADRKRFTPTPMVSFPWFFSGVFFVSSWYTTVFLSYPPISANLDFDIYFDQSFRSKRSLISSSVSFTTKTIQKSLKVKTQKVKVATLTQKAKVATLTQKNMKLSL